MVERKITATITALHRQRNTVNGNPVYLAVLDSGESYYTGKDSMVNYEIDNQENFQTPVTITLENGRIVNVEPVGSK